MIKPKDYDKIMDFFYDKTIEVYSPKEEVDEELNITTVRGDLKETFKGNMNHISKEAVLRDYGLNIEASIIITCSRDKGSRK